MTDSTLPLASFSTAANCAVGMTNMVSPPSAVSNAGTIVTEATTGGVAVVLSLLHAAIIAAAATSPTSTFFMQCSLQLLSRAPGSLPRLIHLRPDLRRALHQECGARPRSGRAAVGWADAAPCVTRAATKLQHA